MGDTNFEFADQNWRIFRCGGLDVGYDEAVERLNPGIEWKSSYGGFYQGEWVALGKDGAGKFHYHSGAYGSCSGCDWLESIHDVAGAVEFLKDMQKVACIGTAADAVRYLRKEHANGWDDLKEAIEEVVGAWGLTLAVEECDDKGPDYYTGAD